MILGLGNPGKKYDQTPHNLGFMVVDALVKHFSFPDFALRDDCVMASEGIADEQKIILAKPQMFMNRSGVAVKRIASHYPLLKKRGFRDLWVINDDLDLPFGKIRIGKNRGGAGHKGVQSVIDQIKTKDFVRFRLGIQKPEVANGKIIPEKFVLKKFPKKDAAVLKDIIDRTVKAVETALKESLDKAMTDFNR